MTYCQTHWKGKDKCKILNLKTVVMEHIFKHFKRNLENFDSNVMARMNSRRVKADQIAVCKTILRYKSNNRIVIIIIIIIIIDFITPSLRRLTSYFVLA
jgi:hypothetical protein